ncbi:penicillin-binding protein activator [Thalassotalea insulae]|nr:penicillin-binding protein activator [Thalassotalea insulae]
MNKIQIFLVNTIYMMRNLPAFLIIFLLLSLTLSCSTSQRVTKIKSVTKPSKAIETSHISADDILAQAQQSEPAQATDLLIQACQQYLAEKNYVKSLWLAQQLIPLASSNVQQYQIQLLKAQNLYLLDKIELSLKTLQQAKSALTNENQLTASYYQLLAQVQSKRGLLLIASDAQLRAFHLQENPTDDQIIALWQQLNQLSQWQIEQLVALSPPQITGWQQLLNFAHRFGYQPQSLERYLIQWRRNYPAHPAQVIAQQLLSNDASVDKLNIRYRNIAVILPLSGKHQAAGESAQQGILAGYNANSEMQLHFIDSTSVDFATLAEKLAELEIEYIIGPLLKPNVDAYIAQQNLTLPTLLLNVPVQQQAKAQQMVFSMDAKDEAIQAATTLSRKQFKHPIVLSQHDNVSQHIALTFVNQWQKVTGTAPEIIFFDNRKDMQQQLKQSLGVEQSQERIDEIDRRIRQKLKTEARNRRDIDMIYLVSTPNETRLLKPYIDVNISPFADIIPIFASSRSHSDNADRSDSRDLTGLKFTEMPWLLKSKQQNVALKQVVNNIWPNSNDNLKRIFAMGYDSLSLINKFSVLKQPPYIRHYGQTGVLKLNEQGILTRSLLWGSYQKDKVEQVAMD